MSVLPGAEPFLIEPSADPAGELPIPPGRVGVVLCHGFTGSPQSMRGWGEHLAAAGATVHCPRLPGHGTRWQDMNATRWEDWYGEIERALDAMLARLPGPDPLVFAMGMSMGGTLATRLAEQRGADLAGLVLVNPSYTTLRKDAFLLPALSRIIPSFPGIANDIKKPGAAELAYSKIPLKAAHSLNQLWRVVRADLAKVNVPIRLFRSAEDHVVEPVNAQILLDGVSSVEVDEIVLMDSYHVATLDNDAERIFTGSVEFVTNRLPSAADPDPSR
ncbi:MAG: yvaK [Actinomycetia bacterium]|nr:yvaK [Actinomycetes bacterium]MDQ1659915.1 carboxylesterase [Cryptosporangiaceae bacterium]